jgi:hypothetical protein
MTFRLERRMLNIRWVTSRARLLTIDVSHDLIHILYEGMDDPENLRRRRPSLIFRESVKPLQYCFDVLLSKMFFYEPRCGPLNNVVTHQ